MNKNVIALGFFDGLHRGHAELVKRTKLRAKEIGAEPTVLTFDVHPDTYVSGRDVPLLTSNDERADIIRRLFEVDNVLFIHFSEEVMHMSWRDFLDALCDEAEAVHLVVGHNFRFGYKGEGNIDRLREYCEEKGLGCDVIEPVTFNGKPISSTRIRAHVLSGEMESANELLGHPHELSETVYYGYKLGRRIGSPTINMRIPENVIVPRFGVYATCVFFEGEKHNAVTNIGVRPTVKHGTATSVESYILDYSGNLYGKRVRVEFHSFLRPEQLFESIEALKEQISKDEKNARAYFASKEEIK